MLVIMVMIMLYLHSPKAQLEDICSTVLS